MEQMNVPDETKLPIDYEDESLPASVRTFRPLIYQDGELICAVLGPDPQTGVFGSGATQEEAIEKWDLHLQDLLKYHKEDDKVARYIIETLKASVNKVW
jgi:hypothetical protein